MALLVENTTYGNIGDWFAYVQPLSSPRLKIGYGPTGVMAAEAYPYLDSKQLCGMMPGLKGAADYEKLVDVLETKELKAGHIAHPEISAEKISSIQAFPPAARKLMFAQSTAHIVIILFILLGNLGLLLSRRLAKKTARKEDA